MRLGVYADLVYRREGDTLSTDRSFILFVTNLAPRLGELVLFGRFDPEPGRSFYELPREGVRFVPLPHYPSITDVLGVLRAYRGARRAFLRELPSLDAVWIFGPHPLALALALAALRRGKPVRLGVRQDFPQYIGNRLPSRAWAWAVPVAHGLEWAWQRLSARAPAVVVGDVVARRYPGSLATGFSLIRDDDVVPVDDALARTWGGRILTVGRIDPEKNPLLLPEILRRLRATDQSWRLTIVGRGPLEEALLEHARALGVDDALEVRGYVPNGPELWALYRASDVFLLVSFTEGLPQVLFEAQAAGTPIVATDVGSVGAALEGGNAGLLVPPDDAGAAAHALERVRDDEVLRRALVERGLAHAAAETMDTQHERIAAFLQAATYER
jgi:glycosyltransferase involved in cell wall biosynthesis